MKTLVEEDLDEMDLLQHKNQSRRQRFGIGLRSSGNANRFPRNDIKRSDYEIVRLRFINLERNQGASRNRDDVE